MEGIFSSILKWPFEILNIMESTICWYLGFLESWLIIKNLKIIQGGIDI
jgi:hypothetical protein